MSDTTTVPIPVDLANVVTDSPESRDLPRWALEAFVLEAVRERLLTTGEAGEHLGLGYFQTEAFLKARGVPVELTDEEYAADKADLLAIVAESRL